jgi:subtilisin family serine protease
MPIRALFVCVPAFFSLALASYAYGINSARDIMIIDSGVDYKHEAFASKMWLNPHEVDGDEVDNDENGFVDDMYGWNFAEKNNQVINYKYLGTFSPDCYTFFEIQGKMQLGTATSEDIAWLKAKVKEDAFLKELGIFGNFVHGTHVTGVAAEGNDVSKIQAVKLLPTEAPEATEAIEQYLRETKQSRIGIVGSLKLKALLYVAAKANAMQMVPVGQYAAALKSRVANGSFGISVKSAVGAVKKVAELLKEELTDAEALEYAAFLVESMVAAMPDFPNASPETLFVFAAGNDGTNNDTMASSPANVKLPNTISVAATLAGQKLAAFSNYGAEMVEVAAPGVLIMSTVPGNEYMAMSGTSMAAPYVAQVAGKIAAINPKLKPSEIKRILMETVDVKPFLEGKVSTGGMVNRERALRAAELSTLMAVSAAIGSAKYDVDDVVYEEVRWDESLIQPVPMPTGLF